MTRELAVASRRQSKDPTEYAKTPAWVVRRFVETEIGRTWLEQATLSGWVDRCAGDGALSDTLSEFAALPAKAEFDINPRNPRVQCRDGLSLGARDSFAVWPGYGPAILENPPFSIAEEFIRTAANFAVCGAWLLRLPWIVRQQQLERELGMADVVTLPDRPSFTGDGRTDGTEYAWFVWGLSGGRREHAERTPLAERKAEYRQKADR